MNEEIETITMHPDSLQGKRVLLIGGSSDLDCRAMGEAIDSNRAGFDLIARVNKDYGTEADCGSLTDIVFVRRRAWFVFWFARLRKYLDRIGKMETQQPRVVAFWDGVGCPRDYADNVAKALNLPKASTGLLAAKWLLDRGADVTVIGYGYKDGDFATAKTYAVTGAADNNPHYDWAAENEWLRSHVNLI